MAPDADGMTICVAAADDDDVEEEDELQEKDSE